MKKLLLILIALAAILNFNFTKSHDEIEYEDVPPVFIEG